MAAPELIVPFPDSIRTAPVVTAIRSTTLVMSRLGIKERGRLEDYERHLPPEAGAALAGAVAGVWLPIDLGIAHYAACDALNLGLTEQRELGGMALRRIRETMMGIMARNLGSSGIVNMWDVLRRYNAFFAATFTGGGTCAWKTGPKDALLEISGLPLARIPYFRHAYGGLLSEGGKFFVKASHVVEVPGMRTETSLGFRVSWV